MDPIKLRGKYGPEAKIQQDIIAKLMMRGWFAKATHGNEFQVGFPDIFASHTSYGSRWVEVKTENGKLEDSQHHTFLEFSKRNVGVWILTGNSDWEYNKLFKPSNWYTFTSIMKSNRVGKSIKPWKNPRQQPDGPERRLQNQIKTILEADDWYTLDTHGNIFQYGFPDMYACHKKYGTRWIEVKNPDGYKFTPAQLKNFPLMQAHGSQVWVLTSTNDVYKTLNGPGNWYRFL